jgi:choline kinase
MNPKAGFILAAGFGTRMGQIGEILPKPLWPFFDLTLIDLQRLIFRKLNITSVIINTHHGHKQIENHFKGNNQVMVINENSILGTGGAIDNAAISFDWLNKDLIIGNSDFFIMNKFSDIEQMLNVNSSINGVMICFKNRSKNYSNLILSNDGFLKEIDKSKTVSEATSYSGYAAIRVSHRPDGAIKKSIFENYLDYKSSSIKCEVIENIRYLDLGEKEYFVAEIRRLHKEIISGKRSEEATFLTKNKVIDEQKLTPNGYNDDGKSVFNFTGKPLKGDYFPGSIILKESKIYERAKNVPCIVFENCNDPIPL